jgi:uncharacterized OB-fold protein
MPPSIQHSENDAPFWDGTKRGELLVQACAACGRLRFPPRTMCPWCQSFEVNWKPMSGKGTIWSFIVPHPPLLPPFDSLAPYNVVVVALEENSGIRMVGNLMASAGGAINEVPAAEIRIGAAVSVVFQDAGESAVIPRWTLR